MVNTVFSEIVERQRQARDEAKLVYVSLVRLAAAAGDLSDEDGVRLKPAADAIGRTMTDFQHDVSAIREVARLRALQANSEAITSRFARASAALLEAEKILQSARVEKFHADADYYGMRRAASELVALAARHPEFAE